MATDKDDFAALLADHCNLGAFEDIEVLNRLCAAAVSHTARNLGFALDDTAEFPTGVPDDIQQALLMLAAHWYENREATLVGVTAQSVPFGYDDIIANHRNYTFG